MFLGEDQEVAEVIKTYLPREIDNVKRVIEAKKVIEVKKVQNDMKQKAEVMSERLKKFAGASFRKRTAEMAGLEDECTQFIGTMKKLKELGGLEETS